MIRSKQQGFTLIELIMVIVILGILAATALPKFVDLSSDAHKATADAVLGSANSAASMNYAKSLLNASNTKITADNTGATYLLTLLDIPSDWAASGATIKATLGSNVYTITISSTESATAKASLALTSAAAP